MGSCFSKNDSVHYVNEEAGGGGLPEEDDKSISYDSQASRDRFDNLMLPHSKPGTPRNKPSDSIVLYAPKDQRRSTIQNPLAQAITKLISDEQGASLAGPGESIAEEDSSEKAGGTATPPADSKSDIDEKKSTDNKESRNSDICEESNSQGRDFGLDEAVQDKRVQTEKPTPPKVENEDEREGEALSSKHGADSSTGLVSLTPINTNCSNAAEKTSPVDGGTKPALAKSAGIKRPSVMLPSATRGAKAAHVESFEGASHGVRLTTGVGAHPSPKPSPRSIRRSEVELSRSKSASSSRSKPTTPVVAVSTKTQSDIKSPPKTSGSLRRPSVKLPSLKSKEILARTTALQDRKILPRKTATKTTAKNKPNQEHANTPPTGTVGRSIRRPSVRSPPLASHDFSPHDSTPLETTTTTKPVPEEASDTTARRKDSERVRKPSDRSSISISNNDGGSGGPKGIKQPGVKLTKVLDKFDRRRSISRSLSSAKQSNMKNNMPGNPYGVRRPGVTLERMKQRKGG